LGEPDAVDDARALLVCKSGDLAGTRFEIGRDALIGRDERGRVQVVSGSQRVAESFARISHRDGRYTLESTTAGAVRVDGNPAHGAVVLDRRHLIALPDGTELVYSVTPPAARPQAPASSPASAPASSPPPSQRREPTVEAPLETMVESAWGGVPELKRRPNTPAAQAPGQQPPERIITAPRSKQVSDDPPGGTMVDANLGALPPLVRKPAPRPPANEPPATHSTGDDDIGTRVFEPPKPAVAYEVVVKVPDQETLTYPLKHGENIIGRSSECDIQLADPNKWLSRKHAMVRVSNDLVELMDLNGMNGTYLNGARITNAVLVPGTSFYLGPNVELTLRQR